MNETFRLKRSALYQGIPCAIFFTLVLVGGTFLPFVEEEEPVALMLAFNGVFGTMLLLCGWVLVAYWRVRLTVRDGEVVERGIFKTRQVQLAAVVQAKWRGWPLGGSLVLKSGTARVAIHFSNFEREAADRLVRYLSQALPKPVQTGWDRFCRAAVLYLYPHSEDREPDEGEVRLTRRRWDWYFLPITVVFVGVAAWLAWSFGEPRIVLTALMLVPIWLMVRLMTPRKGMIDERITAPPGFARYVMCLLGWALGGTAILIAWESFRPTMPWPEVFILAFVVLWFSGLMPVVYFAGRSLEKYRRRRLDARVREWLAAGGADGPEEGAS